MRRLYQLDDEPALPHPPLRSSAVCTSVPCRGRNENRRCEMQPLSRSPVCAKVLPAWHTPTEANAMADYTGYKEIGVTTEGMVATVEMRRPPHNFFDAALIAEIGRAFEEIDADDRIRTIVLAAEGRSFCAGADFSSRMDTGTVQESARSGGGRNLYKEAIR